MNHDTLLYFIQEREAIRFRRAKGFRAPWTLNPILSSYRFTNIRREDDKTTNWLLVHWYKPNHIHQDLWFATLVARQVNLVSSLEQIPFPLPWEPKHYHPPKYGSAYLLRPDPRNPGMSTRDHQVEHMFNPSWAQRVDLRPSLTLCETHQKFLTIHSVGSFIAQQMCADLGMVRYFSDHRLFCAPGPGSVRYLNLVHELPLTTSWSEEQFCEEVWEIQDLAQEKLGFDLIAMDITNCMCESSKYILAQRGKMPKRRFYA